MHWPQPTLAAPEMKVVIDKQSMIKLCSVLERMKQMEKYLNLEVKLTSFVGIVSRQADDDQVVIRTGTRRWHSHCGDSVPYSRGENVLERLAVHRTANGRRRLTITAHTVAILDYREGLQHSRHCSGLIEACGLTHLSPCTRQDSTLQALPKFCKLTKYAAIATCYFSSCSTRL